MVEEFDPMQSERDWNAGEDLKKDWSQFSDEELYIEREDMAQQIQMLTDDIQNNPRMEVMRQQIALIDQELKKRKEK